MRLPVSWLRTFAGALLLAACAAHADIQKCRDASGQVTYTQGSCPPGTQPVTGSEPVAKPKASEPGSPTPELKRTQTGFVSDPEKCDAGNKEFCGRQDCPRAMTLATESSWEEVRACSRSRSLPSTLQWAQVEDRIETTGNRRQWTGDYLCVKPVENERMRRWLSVSAATQAGQPVPGFQLRGSKDNRIYPTKVAAVEAGCTVAKTQ